MPDVSMCYGGNCPLKEKCYRFIATPNEHWQSYFNPPWNEAKQKCEYFWPVSPRADSEE